MVRWAISNFMCAGTNRRGELDPRDLWVFEPAPTLLSTLVIIVTVEASVRCCREPVSAAIGTLLGRDGDRPLGGGRDAIGTGPARTTFRRYYN